MSTPDATLAPATAASPASASDLSAFALRPDFFLEGFGCVVHVRDGLLFDVAAALREGDGVIVTDDGTVDQALREAHALVPVEVPEGALITSHQFSAPHGEHHPQEHVVPYGKQLWGEKPPPAEEAAPEPTPQQDPELTQPVSPPAEPAEPTRPPNPMGRSRAPQQSTAGDHDEQSA